MVARVNTVSFQGIDVKPVDVQVQISNGLPAFTIVGSVKTVFSVFIFITVSVFYSPAFASFEGHFLKISCVPEFEFFSINSFSLQDTDELPNEKSLMTGIYSLRQLVGDPYECQLKHHIIRVEKVAYNKPRASGQCGGAESATFSIKFDNIDIARINSGGSCYGQNYTSEVMLAPGSQRNCTIYFNDSEVKSECIRLNVPYWYENADWYKRKMENKNNGR